MTPRWPWRCSRLKRSAWNSGNRGSSRAFLSHEFLWLCWEFDFIVHIVSSLVNVFGVNTTNTIFQSRVSLTYHMFCLTPQPLLQATYTGVQTTVLGNIFFPSFLAKTKREQPLPSHIHCETWPRSLRFWLWIFSIFLVKIRALVRKDLKSLTGFDLPIIMRVKFWWFSFFYFLSRSFRTRVSPV